MPAPSKYPIRTCRLSGFVAGVEHPRLLPDGLGPSRRLLRPDKGRQKPDRAAPRGVALVVQRRERRADQLRPRVDRLRQDEAAEDPEPPPADERHVGRIHGADAGDLAVAVEERGDDLGEAPAPRDLVERTVLRPEARKRFAQPSSRRPRSVSVV